MTQQQNIIDTPEFWEQVKFEFNCSNENYLCEASSTFRSQWIIDDGTQQGRIRKHGGEFLGSHKEWKSIFRQSTASLFYHKFWGEKSFLYYRAVRLDFINYMINRTRTNGL